MSRCAISNYVAVFVLYLLGCSAFGCSVCNASGRIEFCCCYSLNNVAHWQSKLALIKFIGLCMGTRLFHEVFVLHKRIHIHKYIILCIIYFIYIYVCI